MFAPNYVPAEIKRATVAANSIGDNTLIAAVTGKKIRVVAAALTVSTAGTVTFESSTGGPSLTGAIHLAVGMPFVLPYNANGWFETAEGALLNAILSATSGLAGVVHYQELP